jgi:hypothetical protein
MWRHLLDACVLGAFCTVVCFGLIRRVAFIANPVVVCWRTVGNKTKCINELLGNSRIRDTQFEALPGLIPEYHRSCAVPFDPSRLDQDAAFAFGSNTLGSPWFGVGVFLFAVDSTESRSICCFLHTFATLALPGLHLGEKAASVRRALADLSRSRCQIENENF